MIESHELLGQPDGPSLLSLHGQRRQTMRAGHSTTCFWHVVSMNKQAAIIFNLSAPSCIARYWAASSIINDKCYTRCSSRVWVNETSPEVWNLPAAYTQGYSDDEIAPLLGDSDPLGGHCITYLLVFRHYYVDCCMEIPQPTLSCHYAQHPHPQTYVECCFFFCICELGGRRAVTTAGTRKPAVIDVQLTPLT
jgi:hypothetical protein